MCVQSLAMPGIAFWCVRFQFLFHVHDVRLHATGTCKRIHRHVFVAGTFTADADAIFRHADCGMTASRARKGLKLTYYTPLTRSSIRIALDQLCLAAYMLPKQHGNILNQR